MSKDAGAAEEPADVAGKPKGGKKKLLLIAVIAVLALAVGGAWFAGLLPGSGKKKPPPADAPVSPVFVDMPEIIANLNAAARRSAYIKLHAKLEIDHPADQAGVVAVMPRLQDMFQTYLREMRPEELRGSAGTWRLREELIARANIAASPARVDDVLFTDMLIQ